MPDALGRLASLISIGRRADETQVRPAVEALFGERYRKGDWKDLQVRNAYGLARDDADDGVPYAGLIHPDNPTTGPYGGASLVWFPGDHEGLIGFGIGTRGISPDEGILTRPGHRRRIAALRRYLARHGIQCWAKPDPADLGVEIPLVVRDWWPEFGPTFRRYGSEMYCLAKVPGTDDDARRVVQAFFDLYAFERRWRALAGVEQEVGEYLATLRSDLFHSPSPKSVYDLLLARRFVILQGPPGTGKTRLADQVRRDFFQGRGRTIQFHPSITYEDFVIGLAPDPAHGELRFRIRPGALLSAAAGAVSDPNLLVIDELNRADLGKVLGEAIYLFEADEVGGESARVVELPHPYEGRTDFSIPCGLYVLGTMNTADRSIAPIDLAIRRRFAFVTVPPDRSVLERRGLESALNAFDQLADVFVEHASEEALALMPGHAYFLASDAGHFKKRVAYELVPLLDDYLRQGLLGPAATELQAVRDSLADWQSLDAST